MKRPEFNDNQSGKRFICILLVAFLLSACEKEAVEPVERIRAVKTIVVEDLASDQLRKFPGTVEAVDSSKISFEVEGIVQTFNVDVGDKFKKNDVLAVLDKRPFELNVESARAALSRAEAQLKEKQSAYERERRIQKEDPGATTQKAVEQAQAAYESQTQNISYNQAQLDLAERDLANTELRGPFAGAVSERYIEASEIAAKGIPVLEVYAESAMQVAVSVPEQVINNIQIGLKGQVLLVNRPSDPYEAVVTEVGSAAATANAFPVKAAISGIDAQVLPGMTAELQLVFSDTERQAAFIIPVSAFLPGIEADDHYVYLYDAESSMVHKQGVQTKGVQGNQMVVTEGLKAGDILVVAGVPFLADGQKVKLMASSDASQ